MPTLVSLILLWSIAAFVYLSQAVNPACECVLYEGRSQGVFQSPNYPQIYPPNINCILYTFVASPLHIVELTFTEFDLQLPATSSCADYVRMFLDLDKPEVNEQKKWNTELCGNATMIQRVHYSSTSSLSLEFHTDHIQSNNTGFRGLFKFLPRAQFDVVGGSLRWGTQCTYDFHSNKNSRNGMFFSPRYPQNYPANSNCQFIFYGSPHDRLQVQFHNIQLERIDGSCTNSPDYILVRDGREATSPVIARYCNIMASVTVTSSNENLFIEFVADSKKERQGFAANYTFFTTMSSPSSMGITVRNNPVIVYPSKNIDFKEDFNVHGDSPEINNKRNPSSDDQTEHQFSSDEHKNGTFSSPGFPNSYPDSGIIRYTFIGKGRERVQIIFTEIDLNIIQDDVQYLGCDEVDSLAVSIVDGNGGAASVPRDIGVFCGNKRPPMLMSDGSRIVVTFVSRASTTSPRTPTAKGFSAIYNFVTDFGIKTGEQDTNESCRFTFKSEKSSNGTFTSPNFPGRYPSNTECHYLFYGSTDERIHIKFLYFDVEGIQPGCLESTQSDYVEFSNFNIELVDRKMNRLCGTKDDHHRVIKDVQSDTSFFRVTFKSNEQFDATGFEAFFQFRKFEELFSPGKMTRTWSISSASTFIASRSWVSVLRHVMMMSLFNIMLKKARTKHFL